MAWLVRCLRSNVSFWFEMQGQQTSCYPYYQKFCRLEFHSKSGINRVLQTPWVQMACSTLSKCPIWSTLYSSQVSTLPRAASSLILTPPNTFYGSYLQKPSQNSNFTFISLLDYSYEDNCAAWSLARLPTSKAGVICVYGQQSRVRI